MQFRVEGAIGDQSALQPRVAKLILNEREPIETPACLLHTRAGHTPHQMQEVLMTPDKQSPRALMVSLQLLWKHPGVELLQKWGKGLRTFLGYQNRQNAIFMSVVDGESVSPDGFNTDKSVSIFSSAGRVKITPTDFIEMQKACSPDVTIAMADIQSAEATFNRQRKAVKRTLSYLDDILARRSELHGAIFGAVVGTLTQPIQNCAAETNKKMVDGFMLEGLDLGLDENDRLEVARTALQNLSGSKPRAIRGCFAPIQILDLVSLGIDIFDGAYPIQMAEQGQAFNFKFGVNTTELNADDESTKLFLNLWDLKYEADFTEFGSIKYTRSYIHHLLNTHEMLATVALTTYNVSCFQQFFVDMRDSIRSGTFDNDVEVFKSRYAPIITPPH